jgi:hypothetical protein
MGAKYFRQANILSALHDLSTCGRDNQGCDNERVNNMAKTRRDLWNEAALLAEKKATLNQEISELSKELTDKLAAMGKLEEEQATILHELLASEPSPDAEIPEDKPEEKAEGDGGDEGGGNGEGEDGEVREGSPPVPVAVVSAPDANEGAETEATPPAPASDADGGGSADAGDGDGDGDEEKAGYDKKEEPAAAETPEPAPVAATADEEKSTAGEPSTADNQKPESD